MHLWIDRTEFADEGCLNRRILTDRTRQECLFGYEIERIVCVAFDFVKKRKNKVMSIEKRNVMKSNML